MAIIAVPTEPPPAGGPADIAVSGQHNGVVPSSASTVAVTAPVAIQTGVTVLLQEDAKAPSSVPVVSTAEMATPPGAYALEGDPPAAVEGGVPAAEQGSEVAEDPTAAAVQERVRLPHLHALLVLGTSSTCCQTARMSFSPRPFPSPPKQAAAK